MKRMALGLMRPEGFDPALSASTPSPPSIRAKASAIWLRLEFSTHTKSTRFIVGDPQQQPEAGAQHGAPLSTFGFIARGSGVQAAPSVAQAASAPW